MVDRRIGIIRAVQSLAQNPLGIIALFIVLVYGTASLVTALADSLSPHERIPLIYFLILFPILVLMVFAWLVSKHNAKLFAPADFKDEDNYVRMQISAAAALAAAASDPGRETADLSGIVDVIREAPLVDIAAPDHWHNHILWVDDCPTTHAHERKAFEAVGLTCSLALSAAEGWTLLRENRFAAVIANIHRAEAMRAGQVLLDQIARSGRPTPLFFYDASAPKAVDGKTRRIVGDRTEMPLDMPMPGAQGYTDNPQTLFHMVMEAVITASRSDY